MSYKITKFTDGGGEYRFRLTAPNGQIMMSSEGYSSPGNRDRGLGDLLEVFGCTVGSNNEIGEHVVPLDGGGREVRVVNG